MEETGPLGIPEEQRPSHYLTKVSDACFPDV